MNTLISRLLLTLTLLLGITLQAQETTPVPPPEAPPPATEPALETAPEAAVPAPAAQEAAAVETPAIEAPQPAQAAEPATPPEGPRRIKRSSADQVVRIGESFRVRAGERVGDTVIIGGSLTVDEGGRVDGDAVVIFGEALVNGQVTRSLVSVLGRSELGATARIGEDFVAIGASEKEIGAKVEGENVQIGLGANRIWEALEIFMKETLLLGRPWSPNLGWMWGVVAASLAMAFIIALIFGTPYRAVVSTAGNNPALSIGAGLLAMVALPPICLILLALAVGVLIVPLVMLAAFGATLVGMSAAGALLGRSIGLRTESSAGYALATVGGCAIGFALLAIPFMGLPLLALLTVWGLGAATLAAWRGMQSRESRNSSAQPPVEPSKFEPAASAAPVAAVPVASAPTPQAMGFASSDALRPSLFAAPEIPTSSLPATDAAPSAPPPEAGPAAPAADPTAPQPPPFVQPPPLAQQQPFAAQQTPAGFAPMPSLAERRAARLAEVEGRVAFWPRAGAVLLDVILVAMTLGVFTVGEAAFPLIFVAYSIGMWVWKGTTIGGAVMRLRVQRINGDELTFGTAMVRGLVSILSLVSLGIGWFWASSRERQGWQDIVSGTVVVRLKPGVSVF